MAETWNQGQNVSFLEPVRSWALIGDEIRREASQSESDVRNKSTGTCRIRRWEEGGWE